MRILLAILLTMLSSAGAAQEKKSEKDDTQTRIRVEGAAGGTGNITPEQKDSANVGAGPHRERTPGGESSRQPQENPTEREAGRGATGDEPVKSGNGRSEPRRP
jgi:hypothetical protein